MSGCPELGKRGILVGDCEGAKEICCECIQPMCWYDLSKLEKRRFAKSKRTEAIKTLYEKGMMPRELAQKYRMSERQISRILNYE